MEKSRLKRRLRGRLREAAALRGGEMETAS